MHKADFLVIGSGIAGLVYALKTAERFPGKSVVILTKAGADETNTKYAQGGIATVWDTNRDSPELHIRDTLKTGDGLCNRTIVELVVKEGPRLLNELMEWGATFDRQDSGELDLGLEGGHSVKRIVHHRDSTGYEIEKTLLEKARKTPGIKLLPDHYALELITEHHLGIPADKENIRCFGAYVLHAKTGKISTWASTITLLATGGIGAIYQNTTNPSIATGDGIAMAYRAKARIADMEFIQFHPTAFYEPQEQPAFLISEAVRGAGAILRNKVGEAFMYRYDDKKELAPRDIVARAIDSELKKKRRSECLS